jgi:hypothetical protein
MIDYYFFNISEEAENISNKNSSFLDSTVSLQMKNTRLLKVLASSCFYRAFNLKL